MSSVGFSDSPTPHKGTSGCFNCAHHGGKGDGLLQRPSLLVCKRFPPSGYTDLNARWRWPLVSPDDRCGEWVARATEGWAPRKVKQVEGYAPEQGGARETNPVLARWLGLREEERAKAAEEDPAFAEAAQQLLEAQAASAWDGMSPESRKRALHLMPRRAAYMLKCWEKRCNAEQRGPAGGADGVVEADRPEA